MIDDYSDNIDWDIVYKSFHNPERIADKILSVTGDINCPMVFCGFPEVASLLSAHYEVVFVDSSQAIVDNSRTRYPEINTIVMCEITDYLRSNPAKYIVISGRLSAFWQTDEVFQKLASALQSHPRNQILIDYFDRENIYPGLRTNFSASIGEGPWDYKKIESAQSSKPRIYNVMLDISYSLGSVSFSYTTRRAYFDRSNIGTWHKSVFENYKISVIEGLIEDDPGFCINMVVGRK